MPRLIVAGTRDFSDYELLETEVMQFLRELGSGGNEDTEIVSGTARGADKLGEQFAEKHDCSLKKFPADWNTYGKSAGYRRNAEMAKYSDACIVFWDSVSKGTKHMIDLANREGIDLKVVNY